MDRIVQNILEISDTVQKTIVIIEIQWTNVNHVQLVLATVPDRHFGSGSGSKPNRCQIGSPGCQ
jgi:hypothetical protein